MTLNIRQEAKDGYEIVDASGKVVSRHTIHRLKGSADVEIDAPGLTIRRIKPIGGQSKGLDKPEDPSHS